MLILLSYTTIIAVQFETDSRFEQSNTLHMSRTDCESQYNTVLDWTKNDTPTDRNKYTHGVRPLITL